MLLQLARRRAPQTWIGHDGSLTRLVSRTACNHRSLVTLAIETSCDDTSVAILEKKNGTTGTDGASAPARLLFHEKITADNSAYTGIHPIVSLESHQENLAELIQKALPHLPNEGARAIDTQDGPRAKPDFVSVTRGPGMRANLEVGLGIAKGLAAAWNIPMVGVNHMQAHALTPRLVSAMEGVRDGSVKPEFPFLSLLVSGGHTLLIHSKSLNDHKILATTQDIAVGDAIDKIARAVLPEELLKGKAHMYGPVLERFAFADGPSDSDYVAPKNREAELSTSVTEYGWGFNPILRGRRSMEFSFSGFLTAVERAVKYVHVQGKPTEEPRDPSEMTLSERRRMAQEAMRVAFEHLASRTIFALFNMVQQQKKGNGDVVRTLVVSGGVASNQFLRKVLRAFLDVRGFNNVQLVFPPPALCTDNAAMIAWTGMEMFEAGFTTSLRVRALRKWSLDPAAEDGGILGVGGWV